MRLEPRAVREERLKLCLDVVGSMPLDAPATRLEGHCQQPPGSEAQSLAGRCRSRALLQPPKFGAKPKSPLLLDITAPSSQPPTAELHQFSTSLHQTPSKSVTRGATTITHSIKPPTPTCPIHQADPIIAIAASSTFVSYQTIHERRPTRRCAVLPDATESADIAPITPGRAYDHKSSHDARYRPGGP